MKKIILPVVLVLAVILGFSAYYVCVYADNQNFRTELVTYLAKATQAGTLRAEQDGVSTALSSGDSLLRILSRGQSDRKRLWEAPQDFYAKITLLMEDMTFSLYALHGDRETVVLETELGGSRRWYSLSGYATYHWLCQSTGLTEKAKP